MQADWRNDILANLGAIVTGKTPSTFEAMNYGAGVPFITPSDMDGRRYIDATQRSLTEIGVAAVRSSQIPAETVLVSCIGSDMGKAAISKHRSVTNQQINSIIVEPPNSALYVYYDLSARKAEIQQAAGGSAQPILNKSAFGRLPIALPPPDTQHAIAHILGTLDDKIELNRRMNETLEAMARALFKSWFVDFDPVRARMAGRDPGLPKDIADLFPDRLVESELGVIPEGWTFRPVSDLAEVVGGSTPRTKEAAYWESGTHVWATPKDLSGLASPVLLSTERRITDAGLHQISSGLLPVGTVLLSSRAPIGYLAIAEVEVAINQGFIAMKSKAGVSNHFLLNWAAHAHEEILSRANGSTFLEINKASFRPIQVLTPSLAVMHVFHNAARSLHEKIVSNLRETDTLRRLRDTLLPKLISGEIQFEV